MRVLITGVAGQAGSALWRGFQGKAEVIGASRDNFDLSRPATLRERLDGWNPALIVNAAAYTAVDKAEEEEPLAFIVNADAVEVIGLWARGRKVPLIHFSTDYVFDGQGGRPFSEDDAVRPLSAYGRSKAEGERRLAALDFPHLILRTSWVYAARGQNFMRTMIRLAAGRETLRVVSDQIGAPTSAGQIAACIEQILAHARHGASTFDDLAMLFEKAKRLVHFTAAGETSWFGFACAIVEGARLRGLPLRVQTIEPIPASDYPTPAKRPANSRLDTRRIAEVFGVDVPSWQAGLDCVLDEYVGLERALQA